MSEPHDDLHGRANEPAMTGERISAIVAELRAAELVRALSHALAGDPHWRFEAETLLAQINDGIPPEPRP